MTKQLPLMEIRDGSFFRNLGSLMPDELAACLKWASLLTTDRLWRWLRQDTGAECALAATGCEDAWHKALSVLLERHLLNLDTRFDPEPLFEFWEWVTTATKCNSAIPGIWRQNEGALRESCGEGELSLEDIVAQEKNFADVLLRAEKALSEAPGKLQWASDTVARLAARRSGGGAGRLTRQSFARVVFAFEEGLPAELRPAILVDLELGKQGGGEPYVDPPDVFHNDFHQAVRHVAEKLVRRRHFHQLQFQPPLGVEFTAGSLTGESGGLAILLAQILANRPSGRWRKHWFALPPWVVVTATLDPEAEGRACPVGAVEAKIKLLRQEGVRVVVVANATPQLTAISKVLEPFRGRHGLATLRADRYPQRTAERLIEEGCAWQADIDKPPLITRRTAIIATVTAGLGLVAGDYLFSARRPQTLAMRLHSQAMLRRKADEVKRHAAQSGIDSYFRDVLKATEIKAVPLWGVSAAGLATSPFGQGPLLAASPLIIKQPDFRQAPAETSFRGLKILLDSKFFDSTDWAEVASLEELASTPIEPAYFTRVLRLQKESNAPRAIAAEFNAGGLCVVPVVNESRGDKVYYCLKPMHESRAAGNMTRTTFLVIDISEMGNDGQPFELIINAIWFNGAQDQRLRVVDHDWWGTRVCPGADSADLAIRLPDSRSFGPVTHWVRKEDETGQLVPFREVTEGDPLWAPAWHLNGTYTEGPVSVWVIPCEGDKQQKFRWIYSLQWKWE